MTIMMMTLKWHPSICIKLQKTSILPVSYTHLDVYKRQTQNNLFFDESTDERLLKANTKLEKKKSNYNEAYAILQAEAEKHKQNKHMYKLFIGFKKLGEFKTISEAKKYADESGLTGVFNLIGDRYKDSWYAVSYTHLDVYKRQILFHSIIYNLEKYHLRLLSLFRG